MSSLFSFFVSVVAFSPPKKNSPVSATKPRLTQQQGASCGRRICQVSSFLSVFCSVVLQSYCNRRWGSGFLFVVHWLAEAAASPSCARRNLPGLVRVVPCTFCNCVRQVFDSARSAHLFFLLSHSLYHSSFSFVKKLRNDPLLSKCAFLYIGVMVISIKIKALHPHSPAGLNSLHGADICIPAGCFIS